LDVHVSRLRKKLGGCGRLLATVWGVGYRLERPQ
ncbi:MAG TPA: winged helix-turn-helix domain-containing protein, partial [Thermoleophilia bacterium]|nr:winged helix-turn-helix domain-containing protein [Thermoleophilia bacterium]